MLSSLTFYVSNRYSGGYILVFLGVGSWSWSLTYIRVSATVFCLLFFVRCLLSVGRCLLSALNNILGSKHEMYACILFKSFQHQNWEWSLLFSWLVVAFQSGPRSVPLIVAWLFVRSRGPKTFQNVG